MEILLLQDVPGVGKQNDLVVVGDGYALNFLLPQRRGLVATPTVRKRYADQIRRRAEEKLKEREAQMGAAAAVSGKTVTFDRKATKTGKLYAGITEKHIAEALAEQHKIEVKEDDIDMEEHIKALGDFTVTVSVAGQKSPLKVAVKQEK